MLKLMETLFIKLLNTTPDENFHDIHINGGKYTEYLFLTGAPEIPSLVSQ